MTFMLSMSYSSIHLSHCCPSKQHLYFLSDVMRLCSFVMPQLIFFFLTATWIAQPLSLSLISLVYLFCIYLAMLQMLESTWNWGKRSFLLLECIACDCNSFAIVNYQQTAIFISLSLLRWSWGVISTNFWSFSHFLCFLFFVTCCPSCLANGNASSKWFIIF